MEEGAECQSGQPHKSPNMPPHAHSIRVYYEDTDFSGVVYHAAYLRFMERGRTEFLRALGVEQGEMQGTAGLGFAVRSMQVEFLKPAVMDDLLSVETTAGDIRGASLMMRQRILRGAEVLVTAVAKIVSLTNGRVARLPTGLRAKISEGLP